MKKPELIPVDRRQMLVDQLMSARRAVACARRTGDAGSEASARARAHSAKVALGERGEQWWDAAA
jgi:hypothetical protein